ncbi:MAG: hypothetical protein HYY98_14585 [Burkholderiales bacterium]|nr:hypothetical protein [Burkholderiales bacterium]
MAHFYRLILTILFVVKSCVVCAAIAPDNKWHGSHTGGEAFSSSSSCVQANRAAWDSAYAAYVSCRIFTDRPEVVESGYRRVYSDLSGCAGGYVQCFAEIAAETCPANSSMQDGACKCDSGFEDRDGVCKKKNPCASGQHEEGGACVPDNCKAGEIRVNGFCVKEPECPFGQERVNGECKPAKCRAGASAGDVGVPDGQTIYYCAYDFESKLSCAAKATASICVSWDGKKECTGTGHFTGSECTGQEGSPGNGGTKPDGDGGNGGNNNGGDNNGGNNNGGNNSGGSNGGGSGNPGSGNPGSGNPGTGNPGTGNPGTGNPGTGNPGNGGPGSGSGSGTLPPPKPKPPGEDGHCPDGYHQNGNLCFQDPTSPDGNGRCPDGQVRVGVRCISTEPAGGGGDGNGDGDKDGKFAGSCLSGFFCEGDVIQCAIAKEQHIKNCRLFDTRSAESDLYNQEKTKTGNRTTDLPGNDNKDINGLLKSDDVLGGGSGIRDLNITVWGSSVNLPFSQLNSVFAYLGQLLVAVSFLIAVRIIGGR